MVAAGRGVGLPAATGRGVGPGVGLGDGLDVGGSVGLGGTAPVEDGGAEACGPMASTGGGGAATFDGLDILEEWQAGSMFQYEARSLDGV